MVWQTPGIFSRGPTIADRERNKSVGSRSGSGSSGVTPLSSPPLTPVRLEDEIATASAEMIDQSVETDATMQTKLLDLEKRLGVAERDKQAAMQKLRRREAEWNHREEERATSHARIQNIAKKLTVSQEFTIEKLERRVAMLKVQKKEYKETKKRLHEQLDAKETELRSQETRLQNLEQEVIDLKKENIASQQRAVNESQVALQEKENRVYQGQELDELRRILGVHQAAIRDKVSQISHLEQKLLACGGHDEADGSNSSATVFSHATENSGEYETIRASLAESKRVKEEAQRQLDASFDDLYQSLNKLETVKENEAISHHVPPLERPEDTMLKEQLQTAKDKESTLQTKLASMTSKVSSAEWDLKEAQTNLDAAEVKIADLESQNESLTKSLQDTEEEKSKLSDQLKELQPLPTKLVSVEHELTVAKENLVAVLQRQTELVENEVIASEKLEAANAEVQEANDKVKALEQLQADTDARNTELASSLEKSESAVSDLTERLSIAEANSVDYESKLNSHRDDLETVKKSLAAAEMEVSQLTEQVADRDELTAAKDQSDAKCTNLQAEISQLRKDLDEKKETLETSQSKSVDYEYKVKSQNDELDFVKKNLATAEAEVSRLTKLLAGREDLVAAKDQSDAMCTKLQEENSQMEKVLNENKNALAALQSQLHDAEERIIAFEENDGTDELETARKEIADLENRLALATTRQLEDSSMHLSAEKASNIKLGKAQIELKDAEAKINDMSEDLCILRPLSDRVTELEKESEEAQSRFQDAKEAHSNEINETRMQLELAEATVSALHEELNKLNKAKELTKATTDSPGLMNDVLANQVDELESELSATREKLKQTEEDAQEMEKGYAEFLEDAMDSLKKSEDEVTALRRDLAKVSGKASKPRNQFEALDDRSMNSDSLLRPSSVSLQGSDVRKDKRTKRKLDKAIADLKVHKRLLKDSNAKLAEMATTIRNLKAECKVEDVSEIPEKLFSLQSPHANTEAAKKAYDEALDRIIQLESDLQAAQSELEEKETELTKTQKSLKSLNAACLLSEESLRHAETEIAELRHSLADKAQHPDVAHLQRELELARQTLSSLQETHYVTVKSLQEAAAEIADLKAGQAEIGRSPEIEEMKSELSKTKRSLESLKTTNRLAEESMREAESELVELKESLVATEESTGKNEMEEELAKTNRSLSSLQATYRLSEESLKEAEAELAEMRQQVLSKEKSTNDGETEKELAKMKRSLQSLQATNHIAEESLREAETEVLELKKALADKEAKDDGKLEQELAKTKRSLESLKATNSLAEQELREAEAEIAELRQALADKTSTSDCDLQQELAKTKHCLESLEATNRLAEESLYNAKAEISELKRNAADRELDPDRLEMEQELAKTEKRLKSLEVTNRLSEESLREAEAEAQELKKVLADKKSTSDTVAVEKRLEDVLSQYTEAMGEKDALTEKLNEANTVIDLLKEDIERKIELVNNLSSQDGSAPDTALIAYQEEQGRMFQKVTNLSIELGESRKKLDELSKRLRKAERVNRSVRDDDSVSNGSFSEHSCSPRRASRRLPYIPQAISTLSMHFGSQHGSNETASSAVESAEATIKRLKNKIAELEAENCAQALSLDAHKSLDLSNSKAEL